VHRLAAYAKDTAKTTGRGLPEKRGTSGKFLLGLPVADQKRGRQKAAPRMVKHAPPRVALGSAAG